MNGTQINDSSWEKQKEILSDAHWEQVFQLLEFMINDIYPGDFDERAPSGNVKDYFKNKYQLTFKQQ
jgi:hypothetical protein